jgi:cytochrome oxidase Cu insertion factor (SCO1/SenC/PrrC family)
MEYSTCTFMCSATLYKLRQTQAAADARLKTVDFIVISLDPRHDTPASWQDYRRQRDLLRDNWHFLTPAEQHVPVVARLLDIRYWYDGPHLLHDFRLLRTDRAGTVMRSIATYAADVEALLE